MPSRPPRTNNFRTLPAIGNRINLPEHLCTVENKLVYPSGRANMLSNALTERDTNAQPKASPSPEKKDEKPKTLEYHRQVLQSRMQGEQYVLPT